MNMDWNLHWLLHGKGEKMADLKPCPFCGDKVINIYAYDPYNGYQGDCSIYKIMCNRCGAQVQHRKVMEVIKAWNSRVEDGK